jgi:hypothetical protein
MLVMVVMMSLMISSCLLPLCNTRINAPATLSKAHQVSIRRFEGILSSLPFDEELWPDI